MISGRRDEGLAALRVSGEYRRQSNPCRRCPARVLSKMLRRCGVFAIMLGGFAGQAAAAPVLVHAEPAAGQSVPAGNVAVKLSFDSVIDPFRARLLLLGPSGCRNCCPHRLWMMNSMGWPQPWP
ncbi:hypothetical protein RAA17_03585 [Komagataeibacter rhaeticus]|nr:hypothetical protein [Komagataeibacter rhaeticus]